MDRIEQLYREGHTGAAIANKLNEEGFIPPRRKGRYEENTVRSLMLQRGWVGELYRDDVTETDEWWVRDLAQEIEVRPQKIYYWAQHGWVHSRRTLSRNHLVIWADRAELERLNKLKTHCRSWAAARMPELTTPAPRSRKT